MSDYITVVSGLPRSGTSMMMQVLSAGGLIPLIDNLRNSDDDNPGGYFEDQRVKQLAEDNSWIGEALGKVVKVVSPLLKFLPRDFNYKIIFMERALDEILSSQERMMKRRGETKEVSDKEIKKEFEGHLVEIKDWLSKQTNSDVLFVSYKQMVTSPGGESSKINHFFADQLDEEAMIAAVNPDLYRNKTSSL